MLHRKLAEVRPGGLDVGHAERVLVPRPGRWREPAVGVEHGVVAERLEEDRAAGRREDARDLPVAPIDVEVMQDRGPANEAEAPCREVQGLRVHDRERGAPGQALASHRLSRHVDRHGRDVDPADLRSSTGEIARPGARPAAVLQDVRASRDSALDQLVVAVVRVPRGVVEPPGAAPRAVLERVVVEGGLASQTPPANQREQP